MGNEALAGLRILEYCHFVAGPFCAKVMADLGAEVIKIEGPCGDESRNRPPFFHDEPGQDKSLLFLYLNANKMGITLNLREPTGKDILARLLEGADVFVKDTLPKEDEELALTFEHLNGLSPRLIVTSITPFGQTGPYKDYKAHYLNTFHVGGEARLLQAGLLFKTPVPLKGAGYIGEYESGLQAAVGTMLAVHARELTGEGQHVDVSKQEALIGLNCYYITSFPNQGILETGETAVLYGGVIPCKDGYVEILPMRDHQWKAMLALAKKPELEGDPRFKDQMSRQANREAVNEVIVEWAANLTREEICEKGQSTGVPVGVFYTPQDVLDCPQMAAREFFTDMDHPGLGKIRYPKAPYRLSATPMNLKRPAPQLGEHNTEIYCGRLGYSREEVARMKGMGII